MAKIEVTRTTPFELLNHEDLADMPDTAGTNSDHDVRYLKFVDDSTFWDRIGTVLSPKNAGDDVSLQFGDLVSEQNPYNTNAIRIKSTASDVDVVIGNALGFFTVWNVTDARNADAVFDVDNDGNTNVTGNLTVDGTIINTDFTTLTDDSMADALHRHSELSATDGTPDAALQVDATGKVGIGTDSPDSAFHIKAGTPGIIGGTYHAGQIIIQNPANDIDACAVITGYESDASGNPDQQLWYLGNSSTGNEDIIFLNRRNAKLVLGTNNSHYLTILGDGNVGIGTATPTGKTHIDQATDDAAIPVLVLDQSDISEGFINFIGSDRGIITGATDSVSSVRVELGGIVYRLALYADA